MEWQDYFNSSYFETHPVWFHLLNSLLIAVISYGVYRLLKFFLQTYIRRRTKELKNQATHYQFLNNGIGLIVMLSATILIFYSIPSLKSVGVTLFASAGIFAAFLGFASQQAFANIISGIFIVIFKPFVVEDYIRIDTDTQGIVEDITLRHTVIRNFQHRRIVIPNSIISSQIIINSDIVNRKVREWIEFNVSFDADLDRVEEIMKEESIKHPYCLDLRTNQDKKDGHEQVITRVVLIGEYFVKVRAYVWAEDYDKGFDLNCDLRKAIKKRFDIEGIVIPYPYRKIIQS